MSIASPRIELLHSDCLSAMLFMEDDSVDSIVTDPPYGLTTNKKGGTGAASVNLESPYGRARIGTGNGSGGFMGMKWDSDVPGVDIWRECFRVLKPGGHLLAFFGSRTYHRGVVPIEDAGFEIRDQIMWVYGSGFPKSHNGEWGGTALKPAHEPIVMARKPLIGTVEKNWNTWGVGALNIDGCRVAGSADEVARAAVPQPVFNSPTGTIYNMKTGEGRNGDRFDMSGGRWPANLIHDGSDEVVGAFPESASGSGGRLATSTAKAFSTVGCGPAGVGGFTPFADAGKGSSARFFYCAKASKADRNAGLVDPGPQFKHGTTLRAVENTDTKGNNHPTVKPTDLMAYLCRLVTPPGGVVLDPFMGSGSTGKAAVREGFRFIGIEREAAYITIAQARINHEMAKTGGAA